MLSSTATITLVSAVGYSSVVDGCPAGASIRALPYALIIFVYIYVPDIHLIAARDNRKLAAINGTRGRLRQSCGASRRGQFRAARLVGQPRPGHAVERGIDAVVAHRRVEQSCQRIEYDSGDRGSRGYRLTVRVNWNVQAPGLASINRGVEPTRAVGDRCVLYADTGCGRCRDDQIRIRAECDLGETQTEEWMCAAIARAD